MLCKQANGQRRAITKNTHDGICSLSFNWNSYKSLSIHEQCEMTDVALLDDNDRQVDLQRIFCPLNILYVQYTSEVSCITCLIVIISLPLPLVMLILMPLNNSLFFFSGLSQPNQGLLVFAFAIFLCRVNVNIHFNSHLLLTMGVVVWTLSSFLCIPFHNVCDL